MVLEKFWCNSGTTPLVLVLFWYYFIITTLAQALFWCYYSGAWLYVRTWLHSGADRADILCLAPDALRTRLLSLHSEVQWIMSDKQRLWDYDRHLIPSIRTINIYDKKKRNIDWISCKTYFSFLFIGKPSKSLSVAAFSRRWLSDLSLSWCI